jgi:manganese transport protein
MRDSDLGSKMLKPALRKCCAKVVNLEFLKFMGPGLLVTVGFIDPGNWASNVAAGSRYGYDLLWMVTLSTLMLILLQHNAAHLGIVTGLCLSEACAKFYPSWPSHLFLLTAVGAAIATALAEILGTAIGLNMLFGMPLPIGAILAVLLVGTMLICSYRKLEKWIIGFVSLIGLCFLFELTLVKIEWPTALRGWFVPSLPAGSLPIVMSVLGAVVMPHNLFLHSEIIQSRQWNLREKEVIRKQLKFEFMDTLSAMVVGWAINSAMILVAASVFYSHGRIVDELPQAQATLGPLLGSAAAFVFALALLFAGISSSVNAAMAGGSIWAGMVGRPFDISESHSRIGVVVTLLGALLIIFFLRDLFQGLIWSQIVLSIQLPWTTFSLIFLTSSKRVMGQFANSLGEKIALGIIAAAVSCLNIMLFIQII